MVALFLVFLVAAGNVAIGFVVATALGHGPAWAAAYLPKPLRNEPTTVEEAPADLH